MSLFTLKAKLSNFQGDMTFEAPFEPKHSSALAFIRVMWSAASWTSDVDLVIKHSERDGGRCSGGGGKGANDCDNVFE